MPPWSLSAHFAPRGAAYRMDIILSALSVVFRLGLIFGDLALVFLNKPLQRLRGG